MKMELHVLLIEPSEASAAPVMHQLIEAGYVTTVQRVETAVSLQAALSNHSWQVVIVNAQTPALPATAVLDTLQTAGLDLPMIVVDAHPQVQTAVSLLKAGASDYLPQDELARLGTAVQQALATIQTRAAQAQQRVDAIIQHEKALSDSLINSLPGIFYLFDEQGKFLRWNENFEKVSGYSVAEFSLMHPLDFFTDQDKALIQERIGAVFQTGKSNVEANLMTKDGRRLPHYFTGSRIQFNNAPCLIGMGIDIGERKQAEKSLLELKQAVDASGDVIFLTDKDGLITTINAQFTHLYGYSADEVVGKTTPRILKSGKQDKTAYERFWQTILGGEMFRGEVVNKTKDGRFVVIEETVTPFFDNEDEITGFLAIQRDVTAQKQTEQALQEARDFLEMALAQSPSGILIASAPDVAIQMANPAAFQIRGGDPKLLTGIDMTQHARQWQIYRPDGDPYLSQDLPLTRAVLHGELVQDEQMIIRDQAGQDHWVSANAAPIRNPQGEISAGIVIFHDITERKRAEDELRLQGAALASVANAILITDVNGVIEWANPAYTRLTGYEVAETIGKNPRILKSGVQGAAFYKTLWETILAGDVWHGELVNRRKDGTLYSEEQTITPLRNEDGKITHFITIKQDITERKRAESEIQRHLVELQAVYVNSIAINHLLEPGAIGEHLIKTLAHHLDWHHVTVRLRRGEDDLELVAFNQAGMEGTERAQVARHFNSLIHKLGQGLSGWVAQTGVPLRADNVQAYPHYIETFPGICSGMYAPLLIGERVVGCISVESETPHAFTENDERLLLILASQAAVAFENAHLYQAIQQELEERRQAEVALQQQFNELQASRKETDFLANLLEQSSQPLGVGFPDGRFGMVNTAFCHLVGYRKEELQAMDWNKALTAPEWWESELRHLQWLQQNDQPVRYEKEYIHKDGRRIPVELFVHLMRDEMGAIAYYYAFITDITERKQHEREQEAIIAVSTALRAAPTRVEMLPIILDQIDALLQAEGTALLMADPINGDIIVEAAHGVFAAAVHDHRKAGEGLSYTVIVNGQPFVTPDIHQEKGVTRPELFRQVRAVACVPLLAQEQVSGAIWVGRQNEITPAEMRLLTAVADMAANALQRATLHEQTRKQAEQITQIMHSVPDGVLLLNARYQILLANPPAREYLALLAGAQIGDTLSRLADRPLDELLTSPPSGRWHDLAQAGRTFEVIARPLANGPTPTGWVLVLRDVTERRSVQRQLYEQERLAAIGQLAAGIAHDFNNLLAVITLYTELVAQSSRLDERNQGRLATIMQQANHAAHMVKQILDFSRRSTLERRPLDLVPLFGKQVELLQRTLPEHIEVGWRCELDEMLVLADATRLQQVIMNLAINARDALPHGGRVTLELSQITLRPRQEPPVVGMSPGHWVCLRVADTGGGIAAENLSRIFEPFFTTKTPGKGTGLGLAQVYGIVAQHNGHITVASKMGEGTTFTVYLPELTIATDLPLAEDSNAERPSGHGELVLVVEDNETLRASLVEHLRQWHYRVVEAANGEEGLARLSERGAELALILSDVVMPRLGGVELFQMLRQQDHPIPMILMSGHSLEEGEVAALQRQGLYGWLPKPLDIDRLAQMAAAAVSKPRTAA